LLFGSYDQAMARARVIPAILLLWIGAACGATPSASPASATSSVNVSGVLERGPTPTCPADEPCDPPPRASNLIFSRPGETDVRVTVAGDGSFALHLDPGKYSITTAPPPFQQRVVPSEVVVPAAGSVFLRLQIARSP
jgi:hypothetical protein